MTPYNMWCSKEHSTGSAIPLSLLRMASRPGRLTADADLRVVLTDIKKPFDTDELGRLWHTTRPFIESQDLNSISYPNVVHKIESTVVRPVERLV